MAKAQEQKLPGEPQSLHLEHLQDIQPTGQLGSALSTGVDRPLSKYTRERWGILWTKRTGMISKAQNFNCCGGQVTFLLASLDMTWVLLLEVMGKQFNALIY